MNAAERAFYDTLAQSDSAKEVIINGKLRFIATLLVTAVQNNSGTDWWRRDNVRAKMRGAVKKLLREHGYPPYMTKAAITKLLQQAEALAREVS